EAVVERLLKLNLVTVSRRASGPSAPQPDPLVILRHDPPTRHGRPSPLLTRLRRGPALRSELLALSPSAGATLRRWAEQGAITLDATPRHRKPVIYTTAETPPPLTSAQHEAWAALQSRIGNGGAFLLHGVTASGKTELYLRALGEAIRQGKRGIVLVPEIALTPQTVERFDRRFPGRVALIHSRLTDRQRHDTMRRIAVGGADVVIGPRSALFAPMPSLGVIVVDEEHDASYKSADPPRYHAREVAVELGRRSGATVILGSATPAVETYLAATHGDFTLLTLPERATGSAPPSVTVVDLRAELRAGNRSMFSRALMDALAGVVARGEQAILFLNRRGSASIVQCRDCGHVARCGRCDAVLTYHAASDDLTCHQCNRRQPTPTRCPSCRSNRIRFLGAGTESVCAAAQAAFPTARVGRLDSDVTRDHKGADAVLNAFRAGDL
ncbi:MAG: primosomal protein N', partial [Dehalococcoidia bacterium]|nr:primosomal protein N' [Dehalococcoidia bacterium]